MLTYPVRIDPDGDQFLAKFRDIPEAITGAKTREEVLELAKDALITAMDFYFEDKRQVPLPTNPIDHEESVSLPLSVSAKVLLLNEMLNQQVKPSELARRINVTRQEANRILNLEHPTKIDSLAEAMSALGKHFELRVIS